MEPATITVFSGVFFGEFVRSGGENIAYSWERIISWNDFSLEQISRSCKSNETLSFYDFTIIGFSDCTVSYSSHHGTVQAAFGNAVTFARMIRILDSATIPVNLILFDLLS